MGQEQEELEGISDQLSWKAECLPMSHSHPPQPLSSTLLLHTPTSPPRPPVPRPRNPSPTLAALIISHWYCQQLSQCLPDCSLGPIFPDALVSQATRSPLGPRNTHRLKARPQCGGRGLSPPSSPCFLSHNRCHVLPWHFTVQHPDSLWGAAQLHGTISALHTLSLSQVYMVAPFGLRSLNLNGAM